MCVACAHVRRSRRSGVTITKRDECGNPHCLAHSKFLNAETLRHWAAAAAAVQLRNGSIHAWGNRAFRISRGYSTNSRISVWCV